MLSDILTIITIKIIVSVVIQRFNAIAFHSTFVVPDLDNEGHPRSNIAY